MITEHAWPMPTCTEVTLTAADDRRAYVVALARFGNCLVDKRPTRYGAAGTLDAHVDGARGEIAFARMIGADLAAWARYAAGKLGAVKGDVEGWEVRATAYRRGHLIIRPHDDPAAPFALVVTAGRLAYRAVGWIPGGDARRAQWWHALTPGLPAAWCVPQDALRPFTGE